MRIVVATGNKDKLREFKEILKDLGSEIISSGELGIKLVAEENGDTFEENAYIKARECFDKLEDKKNTVVVADDSGLCVDYLDGKPGIMSARYMGYDTSYTIKNQSIIDALKDAKADERGAGFVCSICAILENGEAIYTKGVMRGEIAREISGANGFGYDPILYLPEYGKTSATISDEEKNKISHRGQALRALEKILKENL
ncbi:MAG: RdgB/HAM1 family non-canonical purine NTP pyrophosphatase [Eubacteriales bacterium]|nr:RdgB/HAM1 family non-canonical purine NTP pyrophosphatase [Eubacteriales bacterium]